MNPAPPFDLIPALGLTLVWFLGQGALIGLGLAAILTICRSAQARHNWALAALMLCALAPAATFIWLSTGQSAAGGPAASPVSPWQEPVVLTWWAGVAVLAARAGGGLWLVERLRRQADALPQAWLIRCRDLARHMAVQLPVAFRQSDRIGAPVAVGWLKPVVLIPTAALLRLPADQLEALILHELAHLRRLDPFINLFQAAMETLLFYHPAVWWISRQIRLEREHCCDDMVLAQGRDPGAYARALQTVEALRPPPGLALAASGGQLKARIARLLGMTLPSERPPLARAAALSLAAVFSLVALIGTAQVGIAARHVEAPTEAPPVVAAAALAEPPPRPVGPNHARHSLLRRVTYRPTPEPTPPGSDVTAASPVAQPELDARLDELQALMTETRGLKPAGTFQRNRDIRALRAKIIALQTGAAVER